MKQPVVITLTSLVVNTGASLAVTGCLLAAQNWFGSGDTPAFLLWTLPLAASVAVGGPVLLSLLRRLPVAVRLLLLAVATVLLTIGWLLLLARLLGPWMGAFSFPIIYPWLAGVAAQLFFLNRFLPPVLTNKSGLRYGLVSLVAIGGALAGLYGVFALHEYLNRPIPETYLIPVNFRGSFRVVYGESGGVNPRLKNGRRVIDMNSSGILIIQPDFKAGSIDHEYYLVDSLGNQKKLRSYPTPPTGPSIEMRGTGILGGAMPDGSYSSDSPQAINYTEFIVADQPVAELSYVQELQEHRAQQRLDSLTELLVRRCRTK